MAVGVVVHKALIWRFGQNKFMYVVVVNAAEITFLYTSKKKKNTKQLLQNETEIYNCNMHLKLVSKPKSLSKIFICF